MILSPLNEKACFPQFRVRIRAGHDQKNHESIHHRLLSVKSPRLILGSWSLLPDFLYGVPLFTGSCGRNVFFLDRPRWFSDVICRSCMKTVNLRSIPYAFKSR